MRAAITSKLKEITNFGNRCYQSFTAPTNVVKPTALLNLAVNIHIR